MKVSNNYNGIRLDKNNIKHYLALKYGKDEKTVKRKSIAVISSFNPLIQDDYGLAGDCAITSMTACVNYLTKSYDVNIIYEIVEDIGKKFLYRGDKWGTPMIFNANIYKQALKKFKVKKSVLFTPFKCLKTIKKQINKDIPVILSILNDGRDCYKNHTITIVGYEQFNVDGKIAEMLIVYDNWDKEYHYVDYELLNKISPLVY